MPLHVVQLVTMYIKTLRYTLLSACIRAAVAWLLREIVVRPKHGHVQFNGPRSRPETACYSQLRWTTHWLACLTWPCSFSIRQQRGQTPYTTPENNRETP